MNDQPEWTIPGLERAGEFPLQPIWDALIAERDGREPAQFEGWETWDDSAEAQEAFQRGLDYAASTPAPWVPSEPAVATERPESPKRTKRRRKPADAGAASVGPVVGMGPEVEGLGETP